MSGQGLIQETDTCIFCQSTILDKESVKLTEKGCQGINNAALERGDDLFVILNQIVHVDCRKKYCAKNNIEKAKKSKQTKEEINQPMMTRQKRNQVFNYKENCIFCGKGIKYSKKNITHNLLKISTLTFQESIIEHCNIRNDAWAEIVKSRINNVFDLTAADAVYHQSCSVNFRTNKNIPSIFCEFETNDKPGRPAMESLEIAFNSICDYIENNPDEQHTLSNLTKRMQSILPDEIEPYSNFYLKSKLKSHFGENLVVSDIIGKETVITLRETASSIIHNYHSKTKNCNLDDEKKIMIMSAAALIKSEIAEMIKVNDCYPNAKDIADHNTNKEFLPPSLFLFLSTLFSAIQSKSKIPSIGQAIIQSTRPRSIICPLQLGLGVQLHHHFGSKFLIDTLYRNGFSCSYSEVQRFERCSAIHQSALTEDNDEYHVEFVADNVDHNLKTIDGYNTIHAMGMIAASTPGNKSIHIVRRTSPSLADIKAVGHINIENFNIDYKKLENLIFEQYHIGSVGFKEDNISFLWKLSCSFSSKPPLWSGMMQTIYSNQQNQTAPSSILFLPIINLDPGNISCIFTTLTYLCDMAKKYDQTPIITFDQPLWLKALTIIESTDSSSSLREIVLKLGGFHILMSFLGSIGSIMGGSGLKNALEQIYAPSTVTHILSGKAYSRAVRGHFVIIASLYHILYSKFTNQFESTLETVSSSSQESSSNQKSYHFINPNDNQKSYLNTENVCPEWFPSNEELIEAKQLMNSVLLKEDVFARVIESDVLSSIQEKFSMYIQTLNGSMCELWLQYIKMVNIMQSFIQAERTGNWNLHLKSLDQMLPYLAASGHNNYTKSIHLYLQRMTSLPETNPDVYDKFKDGLHVIRRSNRNWSGLSSDLIIEQVLMRSLKSTGGMTRGRGMKEEQQLVWLLSWPICAEINHAMQQFTQTLYQSSEQHKDMSLARRKKDSLDQETLISYFSMRNPFKEKSQLYNIDTGIYSHSDVNAHNAKQVGETILRNMIGTQFQKYVFRRKNQIITMENRIKSGEKESVSVDPYQLFQRLTAVGTDSVDNLFTYELCNYPPALFQSQSYMLTPDKSSLANFIWKQFPELTMNPICLPTNITYVIDGGALIHRIPWSIGKTWKETSMGAVKYIHQRYCKATVVFDGYEFSTTKDHVHLKRSSMHKLCSNVVIDENLKCDMNREQFLSNTENKKSLIQYLTVVFRNHDIAVEQALGDADCLMVNVSINLSKMNPTILVGDDTDLLILLLAHASSSSQNIYFRPEPKMNQKTELKCWDIKAFQQKLGKKACENILFCHAFLGCDTTSRIYGLGKSLSVKKILSDNTYFLEQAVVFSNPTSKPCDIICAGEKALVCLYNGKENEGLDDIRYYQFHYKVSRSQKFLHPSHLPPTGSSFALHSLRVYHQVQQWQGNEMSPEKWGWKNVDNKLVPIASNQKAAPDSLLSIIFCNCKTGCSSLKCSCKRFGMECSSACGDCKGINCKNVSLNELSDSDEESDQEEFDPAN